MQHAGAKARALIQEQRKTRQDLEQKYRALEDRFDLSPQKRHALQDEIKAEGRASIAETRVKLKALVEAAGRENLDKQPWMSQLREAIKDPQRALAAREVARSAPPGALGFLTDTVLGENDAVAAWALRQTALQSDSREAAQVIDRLNAIGGDAAEYALGHLVGAQNELAHFETEILLSDVFTTGDSGAVALSAAHSTGQVPSSDGRTVALPDTQVKELLAKVGLDTPAA